MSVFKFKLQSILELRVHLENEQKDIYASENLKLSELFEKKEKLQKMFDLWSLKYMNSAETGINATYAVQIYNYLDDIKELSRRTEKQIEVQLQAVENARLALVEKMKDRKTLENLKDRQFKIFYEALQKKNEKEIEEILVSNLPKRD